MNWGHLCRAGVLLTALAVACGCGRPTLPGHYMEGKQVGPSTPPRTTAPLSEKPYLELGPPDAKVRVLAFFPLDKGHTDLVNLFKELVKDHPGRLYVKYIDPRTQQGRSLMQRSGMGSSGLLINNESGVVLKGGPHPYRVDFVQDMGRFWTEDDLRAAVAQTVAEAYGGKPAASR